MGLLWITMVTGFPCVISGFEWAKSGITLYPLIISLAISCFWLLIYSTGASYLGSLSGQTYTVMTRIVFGSWGSRIITIFVIIIASLWYSLTAVFLSTSLTGLFHINIGKAVLSFVLALAMAFNNLFGFKGITVFAGYLAAPTLVVWMCLVLIKIAPLAASEHLCSQAHGMSGLHTLGMVSSFVLGFGAWGNEADFWRFSKPKLLNILVPLGVAIIIGQFLFPLVGYKLGCLTQASNWGELTLAMKNYTLWGNSGLIAFVLSASYFAVNDSCLYGLTNAVQNIKDFSRQKIVLVVALVSAIVAYELSSFKQAFEVVANISAAILPTASVILMAEWFIVAKFTNDFDDLKVVSQLDDLPKFKWQACLSLFIGYLVGLSGTSLNIANDSFGGGISAITGWIIAAIIYYLLRCFSLRQ